jgi:hypothetical protein
MCTELKNVVLPASVSYISDLAFKDCRGINAYFVDPDNPNYSSIDGCIYSKDSKKLFKVPEIKESCLLPEGLKCVGSRAFCDCTKLKELRLPDQLSEIEDFAFYGCWQLEGINLPKKIMSIGKYAFAGCSKMTLSDSVFSSQLYIVDDYAFKDCHSINAVKLSPSIKVLGEGVFSGCNNLEFCQMPSTYLRIPDFFFSGCTKLNQLSYSSEIEYVGRCSFKDCTSLNRITIPPSCKELLGNPFGGLNRDSIVIDNPNFYYENGLLIDTNNNAVISYCAVESAADIIIPKGIVKICANAFENSDIASVSLPCSLETIETMSFAGCKNIKDIIFRSSLKNIKEGAFNGCKGMRSIHFDDGGKNELVLGRELFSMLDL